MSNAVTNLSKKVPTDIFEACRSGDLAAVQKLANSIDCWMMQEPISLKYPHEMVIECGHLHILRWMVEASGKEIVWTDFYAARAGVSAMNSANLDVFTYLIESKPTGFDAGACENVILLQAIANNRLDIVKLLFEVALKRGHGIDVNAFGGMLLLADDFKPSDIVQYIVNEVPIIAQHYPNLVGNKKWSKARKLRAKDNLLAATGFTVEQILARYDKIKRMFKSGCDQDYIRENVDKAVASTPQRVRQKVL